MNFLDRESNAISDISVAVQIASVRGFRHEHSHELCGHGSIGKFQSDGASPGVLHRTRGKGPPRPVWSVVKIERMFSVKIFHMVADRKRIRPCNLHCAD